MYPASMTKMMTAYLIFERLKNGTLSLDDTLLVSEAAWRKGGSKMFVKVGDRVRIEDLIRGIVIQSGNDATIVVAEGLAGSEAAFAQEMTAKAKNLGMLETQFKNASGWPDPEHYTTAADLLTLAVATIKNFPDYYHFYSELNFEYAGINQPNRNPLLHRDLGADGLKTGHTEASGYGLTGSAVRNGRRIVLVLNGMTSKKERGQESEKMIDWGFREWNSYHLFKANEKILDAAVWLGEKGRLGLILKNNIKLTLRRKDRNSLEVKVKYTDPLSAPIQKGDVVGQLIITANNILPIKYPLIAEQTVNQLGPVGRLGAAVKYLLWGESP
jgi:D-alanyl-D-alanine carboxypeptidase (penicillin-binding protein 5/6)